MASGKKENSIKEEGLTNLKTQCYGWTWWCWFIC